MYKKDIKLLKSHFNLVFKKIKKFNNLLNKDELHFDLASLKNIKYNMKVTHDISYLKHYLKRETNIVALRRICKMSFDENVANCHQILAKLNQIKDSDNKTLIQNLDILTKQFNKHSYLLEAKVRIEKHELNKMMEEDLRATLISHYQAFGEGLKKVTELTFNEEERVNNLIDTLISYAEYIYQNNEDDDKPHWFKSSKVGKWMIKEFDSHFRRLKPTIAPDKIHFYDLFKKENWNKPVLKTYFFGNDEHKGILFTILIYFLLILFGFVYVYPILYMLGYSFMSVSDLVNPNINYIPSQLEYQNYLDAAEVLNYWKSLGETLLVSVLPAICQTISCSLIAWGLARYKFKGKKILFGLVIFTFLVPSCLVMLPTVSLYAKMGITGNVLAYILPALFGQGIKSAVFILIFYQYFKALPKAIIEASQIDGANDFVVFIKIALPSARSAILLTILLSIVWYYNETVLASLFFGSNIQTLPLGLENFKAAFDAILGQEGGKSANEAIYMAGTMLNILPLLILYFFTQKYFIQGVDNAGITGE